MHILILNRFHFSNYPYHEWLSPGCRATVVTCASAFSGVTQAEIRANYLDVRVVDDYHNPFCLEVFLCTLIADQTFDRILAYSEYDLLVAARLRERFGIAGQTLVSAQAFRDKLRMKERLSTAGIPVAPFAAVDDGGDMVHALRRFPRGLVIKPRKGVSSVGVSIVRTFDNIRTYLQAIPMTHDAPLDLIAEDLIDVSQQYHVDGVVANGEIVAIWPSVTTSLLGFRTSEIRCDFVLSPSNQIFAPLVDMTRSALAALPTPPTTVFHAEILQDRQGQLHFCEIASRMAGNKIGKMLYHALGFHLVGLAVKAETGTMLPTASPSSMAFRPCGFVSFPKVRGQVRHVPETCELPGILEYDVFVEQGSRMEEPSNLLDDFSNALMAADDGATIQERFWQFATWFARNTSVERDDGTQVAWQSGSFHRAMAAAGAVNLLKGMKIGSVAG